MKNKRSILVSIILVIAIIGDPELNRSSGPIFHYGVDAPKATSTDHSPDMIATTNFFYP